METRYFCITRFPKYPCLRKLEHTFFEYKYDNWDIHVEWWEDVCSDLSDALKDNTRLKLHTNIKMDAETVKQLIEFSKELGNDSVETDAQDLEDMRIWVQCKQCILNATKKGMPTYLQCKCAK